MADARPVGPTWVCALCALMFGPLPAAVEAEPRRESLSLFVGQMTDNRWNEIFLEPDTVRTRDARAVGVSVAREWSWPGFGFYGIEGSLLRHDGEQRHWEVSAPFYLRSLQPEAVWLPSLAYGIGLSHATDIPESEVAQKGGSTRTLVMWFIELEFGGAHAETRPYLRLHHRSDAFGLFTPDTGSNVLALGVRQDF